MSDSDFPCPSCDRVLNTEGGKRQHHTKVHEEPLSNCTCKGCGSEFYHPKSDRKFCEDCDPRKGENNPNYKDAKEETNCNECGKEFEYYPSDKEGLYCSECQQESIIRDNLIVYNSEDIKGEDNPNWSNGGGVEVACTFCGEVTVKYPYELEKYDRHFCSNNCRLDWYSEEMNSANSSIDIPESNKSSKTWHIVRNNVLNRDNNTCQMCDLQNGFNHVHHMIPKREFECEEDAHYEKNCITLCVSCHTSVEQGKDIPESVIDEKDLEDPLYEKYPNR